MGTWEKPLGWGFGIEQCPWWGGGGRVGRGHVTAGHSLVAQDPGTVSTQISQTY